MVKHLSLLQESSRIDFTETFNFTCNGSNWLAGKREVEAELPTSAAAELDTDKATALKEQAGVLAAK